MYRQATMTATTIPDTTSEPIARPGRRERRHPGRRHRRSRLRGRRAASDSSSATPTCASWASRAASGTTSPSASRIRISGAPGITSRQSCRTWRPSSWRCRTAPRPRSCPTSSPGACASSTSGADYRLTDPADYPRWYGFEHPAPELLARAVYGLPELHRDELLALQDAEVAIVGSPGCYPTATLLGLDPLARAGLIGDVVVDAKSGVSGAGRGVKADSPSARSTSRVQAYGIGGHRHIAEMEQELGAAGAGPDANPGVQDGRLPAAPHPHEARHPGHQPRPAHAPGRARPSCASCTRTAYAGRAVRAGRRRAPVAPPTCWAATTRGSTSPLIERTGRVLVVSVIDNLVKGAAGQAVQAFNVVYGLPETAGLEQLPLAP